MSLTARSSGAGKLDGWIDFNRDGDWSDAGEQIFVSRTVAAGRNLLSFTIPSGSSPGTSFARFRLSTAGGLSPTGPAVDGEVEDYAVQLVGGATKPIVIQAAELGAHEITLSGDQLQVTQGGVTQISVKASELDRLTLVSANNTTLFDLKQPATNLFGKLQMTAVDAPVRIASQAPSINLSPLAGTQMTGLGVVDLTGTPNSILMFTSADIEALQPTQKSLRVIADKDDELRSSSLWQFAAPTIENSQWVQQFTVGATKLEVVSTTPWRNALQPMDVTGDGNITPIDALNIINELNNRRVTDDNGNFPVPSGALASSYRYFDADGNNRLSPIDALVVINYINRQSSSEGEGRAPAELPSPAAIDWLMQSWEEEPPTRRRRTL